MSLTRRLFLRWSALASTVLAVTRRASGQSKRAAVPSPELPGLEGKTLVPLAHVVLPSELGAARVDRAANQFAKWIAGYREGEETLHPYGSERLGKTGPSPVAKWKEQLRDLSTASENKYRRPFSTLQDIQRAGLVREALAGVQVNARVPAPIAAPHVALALLAHFLESPDATNLAYNKTIDPKQCRPLAKSSSEPVALQKANSRGGRA